MKVALYFLAIVWALIAQYRINGLQNRLEYAESMADAAYQNARQAQEDIEYIQRTR